MAQIVVRGLDDDAMEWFRRRAERLGWSKEQLARAVIEREAQAEAGWSAFAGKARKVRERLRKRGGPYGDSSADIRRDRER
jgi:plasmid stability protein